MLLNSSRPSPICAGACSSTACAPSAARWNYFSRIIVSAAFILGGLGGFGTAIGFSWYFISQDKPELLAVLLWPVFFFWQVFPIMATAFTNNPDSSDLLRFPLAYRSFFLIRLAYGFFDPASALGCVALFGILLGSTIARPALFPWVLLIGLTFALFNLVLMQTVFAWVERWLAQRRTREIMGVLFILVMLSFQLIGPIMQGVEKKPRPEFRRAAQIDSQGAGGVAARARRQGNCASFARAVYRRIHFPALPRSCDGGCGFSIALAIYGRSFAARI